ncbi:MAG: serine/threonine protein kinase [Myxococcales bacterium]|nr:serine/threonine protein kinase [Myxococcales bacterium]
MNLAPGGAELDGALARLGEAQALDPADHERKDIIKAAILGNPVPPRRIGRFVDLSLLGHGAMGTVRRAYDEQLAREVAIKLVRPGSVPSYHGRLLREAQALAQLSHPNVVQIYEVGQLDDEMFIAMELVHGATLHDWQRERHPWQECLRTYLQAGRGLAAAHAVGLVHRDFKPSNCIRDDQGRVRVLDFGLARAVDPTLRATGSSDDAIPLLSTSATTREVTTRSTTQATGTLLQQRLTEARAVVGTIAYMAPEQYAGRSVDAKSDQFSFCVALYEALYGVLPFSRDPRGVLATMASGKAAVPAFPAGVRVPRAVRRALLRGLSAEAAARWPSMDALLRALERPLRRSWPRQLALLGVVASSTAVTTALLDSPAASGEDCYGVSARVDEIWGDDQRRRVQQALLITGAPYASDTWNTVESTLDAHAAAWRRASLAQCQAARPSPSPSERPSAMQRCLDRRLQSLEERIELLSRVGDAPVERAVDVVMQIPSIESCTNPDADDSTADPRGAEAIAQDLDRARMLETAARYEEGLVLARKARATAEALDEPPLLARALLVEGDLLMRAEAFADAEATLEHAKELALQSESYEVAVEALSSLGHVVGVEQERTGDALPYLRTAESLAKSTKRSASARALVHSDLGRAFDARGEYPEAQRSYEAAITILEGEYGDEHPLVAAPLEGLAQALGGQGRWQAARSAQERALSILQAHLGDEHPDTAHSRSHLGLLLVGQGDYPQAERELASALAVLERTRPPGHSDLAEVETNLAAALMEQAREARAEGLEAHAEELSTRAEARYRRALQIWEGTRSAKHTLAVETRLNLATLLRNHDPGRHEQAIEEYEVALRILEQSEATPRRVERAGQAWRDLGRSYDALGRHEQAEQTFVRGIEYLERNGAAHLTMTASLHNWAGKLALARGDAVRAEQRFRRALGIIHDAPEAQHKIPATQCLLAKALRAQRREDVAREYEALALASSDASGAPANAQPVADAKTRCGRLTAP